jgi:anti-sigma B factor antagonist
MEISIRKTDEASILDFSGNLDTNTSIDAEKIINSLIEDGADTILFNFIDLNFITSSGLRVLLSTAKKLRISGGKMKICGLNPTVQEVFDISGFGSILSLATNEEEALAAF